MWRSPRKGAGQTGSVSRPGRDGRLKLWNMWFTYCSVKLPTGIMWARRTILKNGLLPTIMAVKSIHPRADLGF